MVYRSISHRSLRSLCEDIGKKTLPSKYSRYAPKNGFDDDLIALASAVIDLQEKRHLADYDRHFRVKRSDAEFAVATSRSALIRLKSANRTKRKAFISLVVFSPG